MKIYKAVAGPKAVTVSNGHVQSAFDLFADIMNEQAKQGWRYHSMETLNVTEDKGCGCLKSPVPHTFYMLIFEKDTSEGPILSQSSYNSNYNNDESSYNSNPFISNSKTHSYEEIKNKLSSTLTADLKVIISNSENKLESLKRRMEDVGSFDSETREEIINEISDIEDLLEEVKGKKLDYEEIINKLDDDITSMYSNEDVKIEEFCKEAKYKLNSKFQSEEKEIKESMAEKRKRIEENNSKMANDYLYSNERENYTNANKFLLNKIEEEDEQLKKINQKKKDVLNILDI